MSVWVCGECGTRYAVGAPRCPHCQATARADDTVGAVPPSVTVTCRTPRCRYEDRPRRVPLRMVLGVVELPTLLCAGCGAQMAVAWPGPIEENNMPKVTVHGGPSNADDPGPLATGGIVASVPVAGEDVPALVLPAKGDGGSEAPRPGTSSTTSTGKPPASPSTTGTTRSRARTTGSRSGRDRTGNSSAPQMDGGPTGPTSAPDND